MADEVDSAGLGLERESYMDLLDALSGIPLDAAVILPADEVIEPGKVCLLIQFLSELGILFNRPRRTSCAAISRISFELWLLKKATWGVTIRFGASFSGP